MTLIKTAALFFGMMAVLMSAPTPAHAREFEDMPQVRVRILDKITGRTRTYDLEVGRTVAYSALRIRPKSCRKTSPLEEQESAAFLQIWEVKPDESTSWVFSGWMFGSSPSLSAMDHPVYDVWIIDCINPSTPAQSEDADQTEEEATPENGDEASSQPPAATDEPSSHTAPAEEATPAIPAEEEPEVIEEAPSANDLGN